MPTFVIGDIHGHYDRLVELLRDDAGLIGQDLNWTGRDAKLWFMGDFFDRGPDGVSALDLMMRLQTQASGRVEGVIGNHDVLILAAERFAHTRITVGNATSTFIEEWKGNGGVDTDMQRLTPDHIAWLANLPAMRLDGERLFLHADAEFYVNYGESVDEVNQAFWEILHGNDALQWDELLDAFSEHRAFVPSKSTSGAAKSLKFLRIFGGRQIVHGHTPISKMSGENPKTVTAPLVYDVYRCVNMDSGMYLGGPGFIHELPPL